MLSGGGAPLVLRFAAAAAAASECPGPSGAFWYYLQVGSPVFIQQAVPTNQPTNQHGCVVVCRLLQGLRPNCKSGAATMELNAFIDVCGPSHGCMCVCVRVCVCVSHHMGVYVCGPSHWCMCVWAITWMYVCVGITWVYGCVWAITWVYVCHMGVCGGGGGVWGVLSPSSSCFLYPTPQTLRRKAQTDSRLDQAYLLISHCEDCEPSKKDCCQPLMEACKKLWERVRSLMEAAPDMRVVCTSRREPPADCRCSTNPLQAPM